jgi:2-oxoglutarate ferredoxin oxidoreductase subunit beta
MTMLVADNQNFALTTGQPTPTSQQGYKNKAEPLGEFNKPLNPCRLAIASGASFIARINPQNLNQSAEIIEKAIKHKGFSFVESLQDCVVFNIERNNLSKFCYTIEDNSDYKKALEIADEWNYDNIKDPKIAVGVIFQENRPILEEKWPQLKNLLDKKICWKDFKK